MMELNLTTTSYQNLNPMMLQDYVTIDQCKDYVASTTHANYILMGLLILFGVAMLLWINRSKIRKVKQLSEIKNQMKMFGDVEALEKLGAEFMNKNKGDISGRGNVPEDNDSRSDNNIDSDIPSVQSESSDDCRDK